MALVIILNINPKDNLAKVIDNREFTRPELKEYLKNSLSLINKNVIFYDNFDLFKSQVNLHLSDYVINFDFGYKSRLRNMIVPSFCENYGIKYFNPDPYVQIICQDKFISGKFAENFGLLTPKNMLVFTNPVDELLFDKLKFPLIIKPNYESESIGIMQNSIVFNSSEARRQISKLLKEFEGVLVEEYIDGKEIALTLFNDDETLFIGEVELEFPIIGLKHRAYTTEIKNKIAMTVKKSHCIDKKELLFLQQLYKSLAPNKLIRIDGRIKKGRLYLIEINANPGLYPESIVPKTFKLYGYNYQRMIMKLFQKEL